MAAFTNRISFTITQPFLGAPLQFQPALGSQELEELIDAYVAGPASKQDKLSEVTIDFYNRATVDLTNGSLVRRYDVIAPFHATGQSPTQSQSSGFSPIFTPSPGSSAMFGDSGNASTSLTPPSRSYHTRVSKKPARKETKKTAEFKLPGFSIMTKDGIDVTSSAGRGTKTKEQREHAHLMRIMKACEACKRKKVRCDPSHRRSNNGSSAGSCSTPTTKNSSPARQNHSPESIGPPLSGESTQAPSTGDFILFPENNSPWNPADASPSEFDSQAYDLSNFDFDLSSMDMDEFTTLNEDDTFEWSFTQPSFPAERNPSYKPLIGDPYSSEHWTELEGIPSSYPSIPGPASLGDLEQPGSNPYMRGFQGVTSSERCRIAATNSQPWPDYFVESPELSFTSSSRSLEGSLASLSSSSNAASLDWTPGDSSSSGSQSSQTNASSPDVASQFDLSRPQQGRAKKRLYEQTLQAWAGENPAIQLSRSPAGMGSLDPLSPAGEQQPTRAGSIYDHTSPSRGTSGREQLLTLEHCCSTVAKAVQAVKSAPDEYLSLSGELGQVRRRLNALQRSSNGGFDSSHPDLSAAVLEGLASQLQVLATRVTNVLSSGRVPPPRYNRLDPERRLGQRQWQVNTRRLVSSLCATISNLQVLHVESSPAATNSSVLTSRHNHQLVVSPAERHSHGVLLTAALPRLDCTVFPVRDASTVDSLPGVPGLAVGGMGLLEVDHPDRSRQASSTGQLKTASTGLSLMILACLFAASPTKLSAFVSLGIMFVVATGTLWAGNGLLARATDSICDQPPTPSIFYGMTASAASSLLAVAASWLPLSTGSSGDPVPSSKNASPNCSPSSIASHWLGMLKRLSIGSSML